MKRVLVRGPGGFDRLELVTEPDPSPGPGQVLVQTAAIGVNFADCVVRMGLYPSALEHVGWPITPGLEVSGTVVARGTGAQKFEVGQSVFGATRFGGYASHVAVPEDQLMLVPPNLSLEEAAGALVPTLTAWYALLHQGAAGPGKRVLVHSAAGGVGSALIQLAHAVGAEVVAIVGAPHKVEFVRALGARHIIDKSAQDWLTAARALTPGGYDLVLDANGVETLRASYALLAPMGRLVIYGAHTMLTRGSGRRHWLRLAWTYFRTPRFNPLVLTNDNKSIMAFNLSYLFERKEELLRAVPQLLELLTSGQVRVPRITTFPMSQVALAHAALQSGATTGKLVLIPD